MFHNQKGMTLIEVLIALTIVSIVFVVMLDMFKLSSLVNSASQKQNQALYVAQQKLEEAKEQVRRGLAADVSETSIDKGSFSDLRYRVETKDLALGLKEIVVTVMYESQQVVLKTRLGVN